ncbi:MAG: respiratory nitrate reductase subunit gamma [Hyphomicrobium sp.]|nr:respiratory nitrate reductase subunit gamma [Hyphomicrobium sp.]
MRDIIFHILFVWYPYFCLTTFLVGSLIRFDREPYSWRAGSSQMLRKRQLFWGSNLFHLGILFLFFGHAVGLLTPTSVYTLVMSVEQKQLLAVTAGGIAGVRQTSTVMDLAVLVILWVQLTLGLLTLPFSLGHRDGSAMLILSHWAQGIVTLQPVDARTLQDLEWPFRAHLVLGMTIFLVFPFSRLVHIWSAPVWYLGRRGYQVVRTRRPLVSGGARRPVEPAE